MSRRPDDGLPQYVHDRFLANDEERSELLTQTTKALITINGGGALAMLGLLQALVQKEPQFCTFKPFGLLGLAAFVAGLLSGALIFYGRWKRASQHPMMETKSHKFWSRVSGVLMWAAIVCFVGGCFVAGFGMSRL